MNIKIYALGIWLLVFLGLSAFHPVVAQTNSEPQSNKHLLFKGIPIDGPLSAFVAKMKSKGFDHVSSDDGIALFEGDFAGYRDCTVGVATAKPTNEVCRVTVVFPEDETWPDLEANYKHLKEMLTIKYGEPTETKEEFTGYAPNNGLKMSAIESDEYSYFSMFETDLGNIILTIEHAGYFNVYVSLWYYDNINYNAAQQQAIDDL